MVVTKDQVFWSKLSDSHEDIIEEHKLHECDATHRVQICRVEITPPDGKFDAPPEEWQFKVDQDLLPEWWDREDAETRTRAALPVWIEAKVFTTGEHKISKGTVYAYGSATVSANYSARVYANDFARVYAYDFTRIHAYGSAKVDAYGSARVSAYGSARVDAWGSATVEVWGSATVYANGSATVYAYGSARVDANGSATVDAWGSATVYANDFARVEVNNSATVYANDFARVEAYDSATVEVCQDSATVRHYNKQTTKPIGPLAVMIDCSGDVAVCVVGKEL